MNFFDDKYRARATPTLAERYRPDVYSLDYAGPLLAFMRGEHRPLDYAGPLLGFAAIH